MKTMLTAAKAAKTEISCLTTEQKNAALCAMADALLANEEYHQQYYAYLQQLVEEYILGGEFEKFYNCTRAQIDELVKNDPNALYTYEEYERALEVLCEVVQLRGQSIEGQLNGTIPSTAEEQAGTDTLIDGSHIDLSDMGTMHTGEH